MNETDPPPKDEATTTGPDDGAGQEKSPEAPPKEIGGRKGPDPTRYGDWEKGYQAPPIPAEPEPKIFMMPIKLFLKQI